MFCAVIHPQIEVKTADSRGVLQEHISLKNAVIQWGNVGGLVAGLFMNDYALIGRSLQDVVAEPLRSKLIPGFDVVKNAAMVAGALGCSISGSGPSIFALCKGKEIAEKVANGMKKSYSSTGIEFDIHISKVNSKGTEIITN